MIILHKNLTKWLEEDWNIHLPTFGSVAPVFRVRWTILTGKWRRLLAEFIWDAAGRRWTVESVAVCGTESKREKDRDSNSKSNERVSEAREWPRDAARVFENVWSRLKTVHRAMCTKNSATLRLFCILCLFLEFVLPFGKWILKTKRVN